MEGAMTGLREMKAKIDRIESYSKNMSKRVTEMSSSSGCGGELCDCVSSCKVVLKQMEDCMRQVTEMDNKLTEKHKRDTERDRKIEKLIQDVTYVYERQDELEHQTGRAFRGSSRKNKQQPSDAVSEAVDNEQRLRQTKKRYTLTKGDTHRKQDKSRRFKHETHVSEEENSYSENEGNDSNVGKDFRLDRKNIHPELKTNHGKETSRNDVLKRTQPETCHGETRTEVMSNRNKIAMWPNFSVPLKNEKERPQSEKERPQSEKERTQSEALALVPQTSTGLVATRVTSGNTKHEVVKQSNKEYYLTKYVWEVEANAELAQAKNTSLHDLEGVKTILLVDTSSSMADGNAWQQAQTFVNDYIAGLEQSGPRVCNMEYLALVTFGAQTRCQQRYTNDLSLVKSSFEKLQIGGPSPLYGGIMMAHATALTPEEDMFQLENGMHVFTKVILITDGKPTEVCLHAGPDESDPGQTDSTKTYVAAALEGLQKHNFDIFCVPVGNANMDFLNTVLAKDGGRRILHFGDGHYFSRRLFLSMKLRPVFSWFGGNNFTFDQQDPEINARDFAHIQEIIEDYRIKKADALRKKEENPYEESANKRLLPIGSRVRRGPDWDSGDQDSDGPGTVVGHHLYSDRMFVQWDINNEIRLYSYGCLDKYCVFPVDEPRIPLPGQPIDVGCVVCPGKDWKSDVASSDSRGVVFRMVKTDNGIRKAMVRWDNGERAIHSYGDDRSYEIQICLTGVAASQSSHSMRAIQSSSQRPHLQARNRPFAIEGPSSSKTTTTTRKPESQGRSMRSNKNKNTN